MVHVKWNNQRNKPRDNYKKKKIRRQQIQKAHFEKQQHIKEEKQARQSMNAIPVTAIWGRVSPMLNVLLVLIAIVGGFLAALVYSSVKWVLRTWADLNIDEIIFHLKVPLEGTNSDLINDYLSACVASAVIILFTIILLVIGVKSRPWIQRALITFIIGVSGLCIFTSLQLMWDTLDMGDYVNSQKKNSFFIQDNYVDPRKVELTFPEQKRNLIYIFLESMETTYMDKENGGAFKENYMPELTELAKDNVYFAKDGKLQGAYAANGSTWTMGGMFAQTTALPLKLPIEGNSLNEQEDFLPDIVALGDVLQKEGYNQTLCLGSYAAFGGRENFFRQHGNYEMFDYRTAIEKNYIPETYSVWWGYEDEKLFEYAQNELLDLAEEEEPFNFAMLTADTHFEDGYVCQSCRDDFGDNQYANVIACSSRKVKAFVDWIQQQDFYENTAIVIAGDHLTMDSDFTSGIDIDSRTIYNTIINPSVKQQEHSARIYTTMDLFPTTLASLGVGIEGERLGLGTNLFSEQKTLAEEYGIEKINSELSKKSDFFSNFTKNIKVKKKKDTEIRKPDNEPIPDVPVIPSEPNPAEGIPTEGIPAEGIPTDGIPADGVPAVEAPLNEGAAQEAMLPE